jgi:hypothetical protein
LKDREYAKEAPRFLSKLLVPKQLNLKSLAMEAGQKAVADRRRQKTILQVVSV